jgi:hypothetical protein
LAKVRLERDRKRENDDEKNQLLESSRERRERARVWEWMRNKKSIKHKTMSAVFSPRSGFFGDTFTVSSEKTSLGGRRRPFYKTQKPFSVALPSLRMTLSILK